MGELALKRAATVFGGATPAPEAAGTIHTVQASIGQLRWRMIFLNPLDNMHFEC